MAGIYVFGTLVLIATGLLTALWLYHTRKKEVAVRVESFTKVVGRVKALWIYPLKAGHRLELEESDCLIWGLKNDRCWMVYNEDTPKKYVNQKVFPELATVTAKVEEDENGKLTLILSAPAMETIRIPQPDKSTTINKICINNVIGEGSDVGDAAANWLFRFTGKEGNRIYFISNSMSHRHIMEYHDIGIFSNPDDQTSFADYGPVFVVSQASLDDLNAKLDKPVPMSRFRPNVVIDGCPAFSEDNWSRIKIGEQCILKQLVQGERCTITCVDQDKGERAGNEPLQTLRKYRMHEHVHGYSDSRFKAPLFGSHYGIIKTGHIRVGDFVYIQE